MSEEEAVPVAFAVFDRKEVLISNYDVVWVGDRCGIRCKITEKLVLDVTCSSIIKGTFPEWTVKKAGTGELGVFNIMTSEVIWSQVSS